MLFKKHLTGILLLLLVVFLFAWIGTHKQMVVPYNSKIIENMDTGDNVPECFKTVQNRKCQDDIYTDYDPNSYDSKYLLKTQVVPPVCPACPSVINNHKHGKNLYDGLLDKNGNSVVAAVGINQQQQKLSSSSKSSNVTNIKNTTINNNAEDKNESDDESEDEDDENTLLKKKKSNKSLSNEILNRQQMFYDKKSRSEKESDSCPPCPAPQRCPEPAFTCEKVVNYRSPSTKQYLPMPVLNDFSSFPSYS